MESSQYNNDVYATATATSFKDIMHSTPQFGQKSRQQLPLDYDQFPDPSEHGSDGSGDMSIEMGRGVKRGASRNNDDMSSNGIFSFGNEHSQYEITGTPPVRPRAAQRKSDGPLRKEASVRRATESARTREAMRPVAKPRAVSDNLPRLEVDNEAQDLSLPTATFAIRGSRFTSSRHVSRSHSGIPARFSVNEGLNTNSQTPQRQAPATAIVQESATYTANRSFMLPDIPNLTELVSGVRNDGTPVIKRTGASRSRFTSTSYKPQGQQHLPVHSIPLPEDEKAIFASLQLARDRITQLEMEKSEYQKRAEETDLELFNLRAQVDTAKGRSDSGLGSDEEFVEQETWRNDMARLQSKMKSLQERADKNDRKASNASAALDRVTKERDSLLTQLGSAYYKNEELAKENEDLFGQVEQLRVENAQLRQKLDVRSKSRGRDGNTTQRSRAESMNRAGQETNPEDNEHSHERRASRNGRRSHVDEKVERSQEELDQASARALALSIEKEVQKHRDLAAAKAREARQSIGVKRTRSRSRSQQRRASVQRVVDDFELTLDKPNTSASQARSNVKDRKRSSKLIHDEDDLTVLSDLDPQEVAELRMKLESERKTGRLRRRSVVSEPDDAQPTISSVRPAVPRKSSLRDMTNGFRGDDTGRFSIHGAALEDTTKITKTVRVQSPHSSQDVQDQIEAETGDISIMSNTSRRRRRTSSNEGMTSAFIIPDITMHSTQTLTKNGLASCIQHKVSSCTVCASKREETIEIPRPVPVTERPELVDMTDATIRPVQSPAEALATVIKNLEDEVKHLKLAREAQNSLYNQHDPAISKRGRQSIKLRIDQLTDNIEQRSDQVYKLYDVLEGQKGQGKQLEQQEVEETLTSIGIDPAEISGTVGRSAPAGLNDNEGLSGDESDELPWEGLSDVASEEEFRGFGR